jgi:hypothetical protein
MSSGAVRYSIAKHTEPRKIFIVDIYENSVDGERVIAFECLCCNNLYVEKESAVWYDDLGTIEPDLVTPTYETRF